nr:PREDICTED: trypsin-1-like [Bemisia tabaci]
MYLDVFKVLLVLACVSGSLLQELDEIDFDEGDEDYNEEAPDENRETWWEMFTNVFGSGTQNGEQDEELVAIDQEKCAKCSCGIPNKQQRIVGGQTTYVNYYPWMAHLLYRNKFYCGATLINSKYALTAAHCVYGFDKKNIVVRIKDHDRSSQNETYHIDRKVKTVIRYKGYSPSTYNHDIALLRLDEEVQWNELLRPVCLPRPGLSYTGHDGIVTGWGVTKQGGQVSDTLQEVKVPIMSNSECKKTKYGEKRITNNMLCAGYPKGEKDSCQGDSGGPLHVQNDTYYHIVGIVSWGEGCAQENYPGVYSRVNRYLTWINNNTLDTCSCGYY